MAESIDCFNIGSIVNCKTCFNDELQGEVLAYDSEINTILLSILFFIYFNAISLKC